MEDTKKDIEDYENETGLILPSDYKNILLGKIETKHKQSDYYLYYNDTDGCENIISEFDFYKIQSIYEFDNVPKNLGEIYGLVSIPNSDWICIGQNGQGYLLLSVKGENYGKVYFVDPPHSSGLNLITNSLKEFIDKYEKERD